MGEDVKRVVTHYFEQDRKFESDYTSVDVFLDGLKLVEYGDGYHDKGQDKAMGFVDAVEALFGATNVTVQNLSVADYPG